MGKHFPASDRGQAANEDINKLSTTRSREAQSHLTGEFCSHEINRAEAVLSSILKICAARSAKSSSAAWGSRAHNGLPMSEDAIACNQGLLFVGGVV
jgi:hypothetical protein